MIEFDIFSQQLILNLRPLNSILSSYAVWESNIRVLVCSFKIYTQNAPIRLFTLRRPLVKLNGAFWAIFLIYSHITDTAKLSAISNSHTFSGLSYFSEFWMNCEFRSLLSVNNRPLGFKFNFKSHIFLVLHGQVLHYSSLEVISW